MSCSRAASCSEAFAECRRRAHMRGLSWVIRHLQAPHLSDLPACSSLEDAGLLTAHHVTITAARIDHGCAPCQTSWTSATQATQL